jgi:hypothetical protein
MCFGKVSPINTPKSLEKLHEVYQRFAQSVSLFNELVTKPAGSTMIILSLD